MSTKTKRKAPAVDTPLVAWLEEHGLTAAEAVEVLRVCIVGLIKAMADGDRVEEDRGFKLAAELIDTGFQLKRGRKQ